ncbi:hypothetical protein ABZV93_25630 [Actinopolymorpha sp. NPDC004070]|uniref:hypothetical protein n=1 Tax=Actinopolymorpha sp. NPDC004070 TaxID=3154548 RepID=UPI0033AE6BA0
MTLTEARSLRSSASQSASGAVTTTSITSCRLGLVGSCAVRTSCPGEQVVDELDHADATGGSGQLDKHGRRRLLSGPAVAGYLAKYATKVTEAAGHTPARSPMSPSTLTPTTLTPVGSSRRAGDSASKATNRPWSWKSIGLTGNFGAPAQVRSVDAYAAALAALSSRASSTPKLRNGRGEAIQALRLVRRSGVKAPTQAVNQLKALVMSAPDELVSVCVICRPRC